MRKFFVAAILCFIAGSLWGQDEPLNPNLVPNVVPPSPTAYSLGNYGNIPVGEYTGTVQFEVPLFNYKVGDIEMPISISYASNGVRIDDYNPLVGLGWNLNVGGVISKLTKDEDDLKPASSFMWQNDNTIDPDTGYQPFKLLFYHEASRPRTQNGIDTEKDLYRLNINGIYSVSFINEEDNIWLKDKQSDYKIDKINDGFLITSPSGIKYYFTTIEETTFRTYGGGWTMPQHVVSAFFLTKIEDTKGNIVQIEYEPENLNFITSQSQTLTFFDTIYSFGCDFSPHHGLSPLYSYNNVITSYRIKKIYNNKNASFIFFDYLDSTIYTQNRRFYLQSINYYEKPNVVLETNEFVYLKTANDRVFLDKLSFKDSNKFYSFEYDNAENLPKRLSLDQDFWGYYNYNDIKHNTTLIPEIDHPVVITAYNYSRANREINVTKSKYGLLKKIVYPTKGYTILTYEPHSYWGTVTNYPPKVFGMLQILTDQNTNSHTETTDFFSGTNQLIKLDGGASYNEACTIEQTHEVRVFLTVYDITDLNNITEIPIKRLTSSGYMLVSNAYFSDNPEDQNIFYINTEANRNYRIELKVLRRCFGGGLSFMYYGNGVTEGYDNINVGGNRIAKIENFDDDSSPINSEKYYYGHKDTPTQSSGKIFYEPYFVGLGAGLHGCSASNPEENPMGDSNNPYNFYVANSSSIISLYGNESQNIRYKYVTKSYGGDSFENGAVFKEFHADEDQIAGHLFGNDVFRGGSYSNVAWNKGLEKKVEYLKNVGNSLQPLKEITNNYIYNESHKKIFDKNISSHLHGTISVNTGEYYYDCTSADVIRDNTGYNPCLNNPGHGFPYKKPSELRATFDLLQYQFISHDYNLGEQTTKEYTDDGTIQTTTTYIYDGTGHLQLTSQSLTNSDGKKLTTNYRYPPDLIGLEQSPYMQNLTNANRIGTPVITETFEDTEKISEQHIKYGNNASTGNLLLPVEVHSRKGSGNINVNTIEDRKITYTKYHTNGNILEYKLEDGTPVSIIWGYNDQYPIAKVEGAVYADISGYIMALHTASNNGTLTVDSFDDLRGGFSAALVTTYIYKPLVGVTTITAPNRSTEYYEYDSFGRLEFIRNSQGEVLKKFEYNYQQ